MSESTPILRPVSSTVFGSGGASPRMRGFSSLKGLEVLVFSSDTGGGVEAIRAWGGGRRTPGIGRDCSAARSSPGEEPSADGRRRGGGAGDGGQRDRQV